MSAVSVERQRMSPASNRYIEGADSWRVLRSHLSRYGRRLEQALKRRKRQRRYLELSPRLACTQVLFDREQQRRLTLAVRNATDLGTLGQVFISEDYKLDRMSRCPELLAFRDTVLASGRKPLIIDGGGNVGFASRYFADNHPGSHIVCIEPDASNAAQARLNNDAKRVTVLQAAIGSEASRGHILNSGAANNAYRIDRSAEGGIEILSINDLLQRHDPAVYVPFIAKIDIEGFEAELFSQNTEWIEKFPLLIVELHDWMLPRSASTGPFLRAISTLDRDFLHHGENVFSISNTLL